MIRDKREQLAIAGEGVYEMDTLVVVGRLLEQSISLVQKMLWLCRVCCVIRRSLQSRVPRLIGQPEARPTSTRGKPVPPRTAVRGESPFPPFPAKEQRRHHYKLYIRYYDTVETVCQQEAKASLFAAYCKT